MHLNPLAVEDLVRRALIEDVGYSDITTEAIVPEGLRAEALIEAGDPGVVCGHMLAETVFRLLDGQVSYERLAAEGAEVAEGTPVARIRGLARAILTGEQVALNFLQRLSGIATQTRLFSDRIRYYKAQLVATRKTAPGLRLVDKYAVRVGGGGGHRFNLSDAVLIKDNHIAVCGGVRQAITQARRSAPFTAKVEIEVEDIAGVQEALAGGADIILLDNLEPDMMKQAVELVAGKAIVEASGRVNDTNLEDVAATGVDFISMGWLTHSFRALDLSLQMVALGNEEAGG